MTIVEFTNMLTVFPGLKVEHFLLYCEVKQFYHVTLETSSETLKLTHPSILSLVPPIARKVNRMCASLSFRQFAITSMVVLDQTHLDRRLSNETVACELPTALDFL